MIANFRPKGLPRFYETGDARGVQADQVRRIRRVLFALDHATSPETFVGLPGMRLHPLKGQLAGFWSVSVSGNWRIVFRFDDSRPVDLDYLDYH
ncbi:MAG TPA: hypothetical protein ENH55_03945 [Aurantimonas coralicida]|uniref:Killer protein n=2 Tax=root TaxID=1 RepID=A0A9C9NF77_9HYPH|nr:hypothetical protein [Aurantimonas coralicida]HEU00084.1 hypothetical protein [Aurantimonas coralicida]